MDSAPEFLNLFVEPTGELIFFLAVFAISQATMLMALSQRLRGAAEVAAGRYAVLLTGVVLAWTAMGAGALYALIADTPDNAVLPPLERTVDAAVILLTGAALLAADSPRSERPLWRVVALLLAGIVAAYVYTAVRWVDLAEGTDFNRHDLGYAWTFASGVLLILSIGLLLSRYKQTADIPLKLVFFVILLIGVSYTLVRMREDALAGDTSGALRLAFLAATPVVTIVVYRLVLERLTAAIDEVSEYAEAVSRPLASLPDAGQPPARFQSASESMTLLKAVGAMLEREEPEQIPRQIAIAMAQALRADVAALAVRDAHNWADVIAAYDAVQQRLIPGLALNLAEQPTLNDALERRMQRVLTPERHSEELIDLYTRLDINQLGPAYIQPLLRAGEVLGVAIIGMPYTSRELDTGETSLLEGLAPVAARLLSVSQSVLRARADAEGQAIQALVEGPAPDALDEQSALAARREMQASLALAQEQIAQLSRSVRDLQVELDYERSRLAQVVEVGDEAMTITQRIEVLSAERKELASEREALAKALQEAQATLVSATGEGDGDAYRLLAESLRHERDELQVQMHKLERQLQELREGSDEAAPRDLAGLRAVLDDLTHDTQQLTAQRDEMRDELAGVEARLQAIGVESDPLVVVRALGQLADERNYFKSRAEKIAQERDLLLGERRNLEDKLAREAEREAQLAALEADIRRLATDREALVKQRDAFRTEREHLVKRREEWFDQRTRLIAEATVVQTELKDMIFELNRANAARTGLEEERAALQGDRDRLLAENTALKTERDQLLARAEGNRELLQQLGADGVGALKQMIDDLTAERQRLEQDLAQTRHALVERDHETPLTGATQQVQAVAPENADVITSIAQELRTPMSSIVGYTDLLLSESVGILGALQRQFLQRVQANIERLTHLINDLVSITRLDSEGFRLEAVTVDMLEVVEDAITAASSRFRERNITLHMNLDDALPPLRADRDAMHQVIMQLLSNAYLASPTDGTVSISATYVEDFVPPVVEEAAPLPEPLSGIRVSITDQGGGVPPEEQRRVFGRLYRADNPLIEGLGDTGVGLSIARALVEAHHGRIWLDSQPGRGSTFAFVVPLAPSAVVEEAYA